MNGKQSSLLAGPKPADININRNEEIDATAVSGADAGPGIVAAVGAALGITLGAAADNVALGIVVGGGIGVLLGVAFALFARRPAER